jgi:hypothetical protein
MESVQRVRLLVTAIVCVVRRIPGKERLDGSCRVDTKRGFWLQDDTISGSRRERPRDHSGDKSLRTGKTFQQCSKEHKLTELNSFSPPSWFLYFLEFLK